MPEAEPLELSLQGLTQCIARVTARGPDAARSPEALGPRLVEHLNDFLGAECKDKPGAALVRFFMTVPFSALDADRKRFVRETFSDLSPAPDTKCLTLMGTLGDEPNWCTVAGSKGHQAIPLMSEEWVAEIPMIARLVAQLGLEVGDVLRPSAEQVRSRVDDEGFNVFHVPDAPGSPYIPGQDFVTQYGIASVVGFGGMLPTGHLFAVLIFSKVSS